MKSIVQIIQERPWVGWLIFGLTVVVVFLAGLLATSIMERRGETAALFQMVKPIADWEPRNEVWGENFPRQYQTYQSTLDTTFRSKHGGGAMIDHLEKYPNLVILWAGYPFSWEYNQARGHYHAINDIRNILRTGAPNETTLSPMPATCWTCKSTDVPRMMKEKGIGEFYKANWKDWGDEVVNPIGCQDCHDPKTMNLRITRPALIEAFERRGKDLSRATHQEMRTLVCAQCHVEYYFKGKEEKYLTFPWDGGTSVEAMEAYYDAIEFSDWTHALSRAPMLKGQHPDYEIYLTGVHAERGVACADCHMPYRSEGGVKFTDHKIQSPLNSIAAACQVCHRESEATLMDNVYSRQDKVIELRSRVEEALAKTHIEAKIAWDRGATEAEMKEVLQLIRHAQWRWDYAAASHGGTFHSPLESARVLGSALEKAGEARVRLAAILERRGVKTPLELPDISTKAKAQAYLGLNMEKLLAEKKEFLEKVVPLWDSRAAERQGKMNAD
ncbi:MAG: ammonia-forming cytochrome c nitrite reductase [Calditrichaceae bacterium]|nr:ammonia-forming cytochrome c nitrite reductase [Calditrichia bacterium]NUQ41290.1 ammonia-forming cytochrome c nitrite reductase [Calditrichaceae bacterium]